MCGISGILSRTISIQKPLEAMNKALAHRGPDADGFYIADGIGLGHRRLSIIDLSEQGNQPIYDNERELVIVYNGELYNYKDLKAELLPHYQFKTESDTEVIIAAFKHWGPTCLNKFNGIFSLAIWNIKEQKLFLARDPFGIKPLYFYRDENCFLFASEVRSLMDSELIKKKLSKQGLTDFLSYQSVIEPNSMIAGVYQLLAGHYAVVDQTHIHKYRYHDISQVEDSSQSSYSEIKSRTASLFYGAVDRQLVSDVPLAIFLSGGIDSTALVAAAARISSQKVNTFSIAFEEKQYDESHYARLIAAKFNTSHTEAKVPASIFIDQIEDSLDAMSTPSGDGPNTFLISGLVKTHGIKVALSGLGGDELFAGYPHFRTFKKIHNFQKLCPNWLRQSIGSLISTSTYTKLEKLSKLMSSSSLDIEYLYPEFRRIFSKEELLQLDPIMSMYADTTESMLLNMKSELNTIPLLSRYSIAELKNYTMNVLLEDADQMSMAHGLELRVPFLDKDLVKYTLGIRDEMKLFDSPKKLLVDSLFPDIPDEIVNRPKMGFSFPWAIWMRNELKGFCEIRINQLKKRGLFDPHEIEGMWQSFQSNNGKTSWIKIWLLVVLEHWMAKNGVEG